MVINFVEYDTKYCDLSWIWLSDEEIRKLTLTPEFTKENQINWFNSLKKRNDYYIWGIECDGVPIGAVGLKSIDQDSKAAEYFGYIGVKDYWSKGIGQIMMDFTVKQAMKVNLNKIYLKVDKANKRAIKLYHNNKFQVFSENGEILNMIREECAVNV